MNRNALIFAASILIGICAVVAWGGPPTPVGAGCVGGTNPITVYYAADGTLGITEQEFYTNYRGIWMQGNFNPTAAKSPCDGLPGVD